MHEREAEAHGLRCLYQLIDLDALGLQIDALPDLLQAAERMGFSGLKSPTPASNESFPSSATSLKMPAPLAP
jgi:shikimate dehydrogenase